ncbi:MAG: phage tail protein [Prevotellaceae bacterium]|nr:phage tail protein [Prevotellaceae bacterium]
MATAKSGYVNGSDLLLLIGGKAVGHCSTHTLTYSSETKDRAVKPVASKAVGTAGLWKEKSVSGLSVSISAEGFRHYDETESGFKELLAAWKGAASVEVKAFERENDTKPYASGSFVITSLVETSPAEDDSTYTIDLENDGEVDIDTSGVTEN